MIKLYQVELISLTCSTMQRTEPGTSELLPMSRKTFRTRPADPAAGCGWGSVSGCGAVLEGIYTGWGPQDSVQLI